MKKIKIAALGDSLTKGVVLNERNRYAVLDKGFVDIVRDELDMEVENYGKFGCTVRYGHAVLDRHPEVIAQSDYTFLEYGGNDCDFEWEKIGDDPEADYQPKTMLESFKESFADLVRRVKEAGSRPLIISLPPIDSENYFGFLTRNMDDRQRSNVLKWLGGDVNIIGKWHESYNMALFQVAAATDTQIIDVTRSFDEMGPDSRKVFCGDGIHPNSEGHKLIASSIVNLFL